MDARSLTAAVAADEKQMVDALSSLVKINSVGPESGGPGEAKRGEYLVGLARKLGFETIDVYESKDPRVPTGKRPNVVVRVKGTTNRKLWVVAHMDTVPVGD